MDPRRRITRACVVSLVMLLAACGSDSVAGPRDLATLAAAEARWQSRPFADYTYEIRTHCFCIVEVVQWVRVTVQDGQVVAAVPVEPDGLPITNTSYWEPIDSLFADLRARMEKPSTHSYASITANYDATLGFPVSIDYRAQPTIADADRSIEVRNVAPYPGS